MKDHCQRTEVHDRRAALVQIVRGAVPAGQLPSVHEYAAAAEEQQQRGQARAVRSLGLEARPGSLQRLSM